MEKEKKGIRKRGMIRRRGRKEGALPGYCRILPNVGGGQERNRKEGCDKKERAEGG
jgi:hypothetical protein